MSPKKAASKAAPKTRTTSSVATSTVTETVAAPAPKAAAKKTFAFEGETYQVVREDADGNVIALKLPTEEFTFRKEQVSM